MSEDLDKSVERVVDAEGRTAYSVGHSYGPYTDDAASANTFLAQKRASPSLATLITAIRRASTFSK